MTRLRVLAALLLLLPLCCSAGRGQRAGADALLFPWADTVEARGSQGSSPARPEPFPAADAAAAAEHAAAQRAARLLRRRLHPRLALLEDAIPKEGYQQRRTTSQISLGSQYQLLADMGRLESMYEDVKKDDDKLKSEMELRRLQALLAESKRKDALLAAEAAQEAAQTSARRSTLTVGMVLVFAAVCLVLNYFAGGYAPKWLRPVQELPAIEGAEGSGKGKGQPAAVAKAAEPCPPESVQPEKDLEPQAEECEAPIVVEAAAAQHPAPPAAEDGAEAPPAEEDRAAPRPSTDGAAREEAPPGSEAEAGDDADAAEGQKCQFFDLADDATSPTLRCPEGPIDEEEWWTKDEREPRCCL